MITDLLNTDFQRLKAVDTPDGFGGIGRIFENDFTFKGDLQMRQGIGGLTNEAIGQGSYVIYCGIVSINIGDKVKDLSTDLIYNVINRLPVRNHHLELEVSL